MQTPPARRPHRGWARLARRALTPCSSGTGRDRPRIAYVACYHIITHNMTYYHLLYASLALSMYIYIYIYIYEREREREREFFFFFFLFIL